MPDPTIWRICRNGVSDGMKKTGDELEMNGLMPVGDLIEEEKFEICNPPSSPMFELAAAFEMVQPLWGIGRTPPLLVGRKGMTLAKQILRLFSQQQLPFYTFIFRFSFPAKFGIRRPLH